MNNDQFIKNMRASGHLLNQILTTVVNAAKPGTTGLELDQLAEKLIRDGGGKPAFKGFHGYPASLCVSINDVIVHGIPDHSVIKAGDLVSLDLGLELGGTYTDMAVSFLMDNNGARTIDLIIAECLDVKYEPTQPERLLLCTARALDVSISVVKDGCFTGDIGHVIQSFVEISGFGVVRDLVGHGVGHKVHDEPSIPNFGVKGSGSKLHKGQTIAIEPMVTVGDWHITTDEDKWTVRTHDHSLAAHFEHTVLVTDHGAEVLTSSAG